MSGTRVSSSPDLLPLSTSNSEEYSLEGIAANVKLLLKLLQDHQEASHKGIIDERKAQRVGSMMSILDDVKTRIQNSQSNGKKSKAELRRCYTDLKTNSPPTDPHNKKEPLILDEKEKLRRDLNTSYAAQKRLGAMCTSLGREKDIIVKNLTRKVQELNEMEELVSDLKAQNQRLSAKIQSCVAEGKKCGESSETGNLNIADLQERNKKLSDQLFKTLEGYKLMKRRVREGQEERDGMQAAMEEVGEEIEAGIHRIRGIKEHIAGCVSGEQVREIEGMVFDLELAFSRLETTVSNYRREGRQ